MGVNRAAYVERRPRCRGSHVHPWQSGAGMDDRAALVFGASDEAEGRQLNDQAAQRRYGEPLPRPSPQGSSEVGVRCPGVSCRMQRRSTLAPKRPLSSPRSVVTALVRITTVGAAWTPRRRAWNVHRRSQRGAQNVPRRSPHCARDDCRGPPASGRQRPPRITAILPGPVAERKRHGRRWSVGWTTEGSRP